MVPGFTGRGIGYQAHRTSTRWDFLIYPKIILPLPRRIIRILCCIFPSLSGRFMALRDLT